MFNGHFNGLFSMLGFNLGTVNIVVCTEGYYPQVRRNIMDYASSNTVYVKIISVHEGHASKQKNASSKVAKRLISRRNMNP